MHGLPIVRIVNLNDRVGWFVDGVWRGEKLLNLKEITDNAISICETKSGCTVFRYLLSLLIFGYEFIPFLNAVTQKTYL